MAKSKYWNGTSWEVLGTDASKVVEETDKRFMTDAERAKLDAYPAEAPFFIISNMAEFKELAEASYPTVKRFITPSHYASPVFNVESNMSINLKGALIAERFY